MHETGVCRSIVDTVERYALMGHAKKVKSVDIVLGEVHDIVPEILVGAFEWMCRDTVAEGAVMNIERVPFTVKCAQCGEVFRLDSHDESTWVCPTCHARDYHLHTGREFQIKSIEVEGFGPDEIDTSQEILAELERARARRVPASSLAVAGRRAPKPAAARPATEPATAKSGPAKPATFTTA